MMDNKLSALERLLAIVSADNAKDCMMCSENPPRKATTVIADIPACKQCAQEYQDAEDALGNEATE